MINSQIKSYDYYVLTTNDYGQDIVSTEPAGQVRMAINITNQTNQDNILYSKAEYIGLTHDKVQILSSSNTTTLNSKFSTSTRWGVIPKYL